MSSQQASAQATDPKQFHGLLGGAVLAIWINLAPENEAEFNNWHTHQHLPERVGVPGFLRGRRYVAPETAPHKQGAKYFALYETETLDTLASPAYLERLNNPTDWSQRVLPLLRDCTRTACRVTATRGQGMGGYAATIEFGPTEGNSGQLRDWLTTVGMPKALEHYASVGIHLCEADEATTKVRDQTEESKAAATRAPLAPWMVMVESIDANGLEEVCSELCGSAGLRAHGATSDVTINHYRLLVSLSE